MTKLQALLVANGQDKDACSNVYVGHADDLYLDKWVLIGNVYDGDIDYSQEYYDVFIMKV